MQKNGSAEKKINCQRFAINLIIFVSRKGLNAMTSEEKVSYFERLIKPYTKKKTKKFAIDQFLRGAGNELSYKFWRKTSSSRMAFDLYSWMQEDKQVLDFEFEYPLPGLKSGGMGPNMDVYIETKDEIIFVESKFTEEADLNYMNENPKGKINLSPGYYAETHGSRKMSLEDRFYRYPYARAFSDFCRKWEAVMSSPENASWRKRGNVDWFDPKQETCHLCGILFFLFDKENKSRIKGKSIRLYNVYWKMNGDTTDIEKAFCERAQKLIDGILANSDLGVKDFKIGAFSVQDMLDGKESLSKHFHFPTDLAAQIMKRNTEITGDRRRGQL